MVVLSLLVVIISIIGADFPWMPNILGYWGWITNTIAIYRLNIFNVLIVFVILFLKAALICNIDKFNRYRIFYFFVAKRLENSKIPK